MKPTLLIVGLAMAIGPAGLVLAQPARSAAPERSKPRPAPHGAHHAKAHRRPTMKEDARERIEAHKEPPPPAPVPKRR